MTYCNRERHLYLLDQSTWRGSYSISITLPHDQADLPHILTDNLCSAEDPSSLAQVVLEG